jgi:hypothetical protein
MAGMNITFGAYGTGALPTIDTPAGGTDCIDVTTQSYLTIQDFIVTGAGATNWKSGVIVCAGAHHIYLLNIESHTNNYYGFHINGADHVYLTNCIGRNNSEGVNFRNGATLCEITGGSFHDNSNKNVLCEGGGSLIATGVTGYNSGKENFHVRYAGSRLTCVGCLGYGSGTVDAGSGEDYNCNENGTLILNNCIGYGSTRYGIQMSNHAGSSVTAYHCTFYNYVGGILAIGAGTFIMKNCIINKVSWGKLT